MFLFNAGIKCEFFTINICFAREYENRRSLGQTDSLQMWWILIYGGGQQRRGACDTLGFSSYIRERSGWRKKECWQCSWGGCLLLHLSSEQWLSRRIKVWRGNNATYERSLSVETFREGCKNLIFPTCNTWWHDTWYIYACSRNGRK